MKTPHRIRIIGSVGSGKTTLAKALSAKYNVPYYELDNVVWIRHQSGDTRRSDDARDIYLDQIMKTRNWIVEGVHHHEWAAKSFTHAKLIIFLDTPYHIRIYRIMTRYLRQVLGSEEANYKPSINMLKKMFLWNSGFEKEGKPKIIKMLALENTHSVIVKSQRELDRYL